MTDPFKSERVRIAQSVAAAGKVFNEETIATYAPLYAEFHHNAANTGISVTRNISYGPHPQRHLLDVHSPAKKESQLRPVVIFFHGGGMVRGDKDGGGPYFGNIPNFFVRHGALGMNATYRLAPQVQWPEGSRDVGAALAWTRANAERFGGDPNRIVLAGHSAGATHVANYIFRPELHPGGIPGFAGAILMSGVYGIDSKNPPPNHVAYYGEDRSRYEAMQSIGNVGHCAFPMLVTVAEYDPLRFESSAYRLLAELVDKNAPRPRVHQFLGHNHITPAFAIGSGDEALENVLVEFMKLI